MRAECTKTALIVARRDRLGADRGEANLGLQLPPCGGTKGRFKFVCDRLASWDT